MKKIKTIKEEREVVVAQVTVDEIAKISAKECAKLHNELMDISEGDELAEDLAMLTSITCAKFAARLIAQIFEEEEKGE